MSLLAAYNFDDISGGSILDISGNGHDISPLAGASSGTGHTGNGLTQVSSQISAGTAATFGQTANRTMMAWVQSTASVTDGGVIVFENADNNIWEFRFRDASWFLQAWNASTFKRATVARPTDGLWHHLAGTYDGSNLRLYLDGLLVATTACPGPILTDATNIFLLQNTGPATTIDDVRLYDEALDQETIAALRDTPIANAPHFQALVTLGVSLGVDVSGVQPNAGSANEPLALSVTASGVKHASASIDLPIAMSVTTSGVRTSGDANIIWSNLGGTVGTMDTYGGHITEGV